MTDREIQSSHDRINNEGPSLSVSNVIWAVMKHDGRTWAPGDTNRSMPGISQSNLNLNPLNTLKLNTFLTFLNEPF